MLKTLVVNFAGIRLKFRFGQAASYRKFSLNIHVELTDTDFSVTQLKFEISVNTSSSRQNGELEISVIFDSQNSIL